MAWQRFIGSAVVVLSLAPTGCESSPALGRNTLLHDPELMSAIARAGGYEPAGTRAQKPDAAAAKALPALLDTPPDRPADVVTGQSAVSIRAIVNDQAILDEEVRASAYQALLAARNLPEPERSQRSAEVFNAALTQLIEREVVLQDAFARLRGNAKGGETFIKRLQDAASKEFDKQVYRNMKANSGIKSDEEFKRVLASEGVALDSIRRQWERNFMAMEYLRNRVWPILDSRVNHQMMVDYYEGHPEEFQAADSVQWQDLFVAASKHATREQARAHAEQLADQARRGADFAALVKQHDDGDSSLRDGDGVGRKHGEIKPAEAEPALFTLKEGQVGPVLELATGYHIIKVVKREYAGQLPFDEKAQKQIKEKLRNDVAQREIKRIVAELKRKAVIEYSKTAK